MPHQACSWQRYIWLIPVSTVLVYAVLYVQRTGLYFVLPPALEPSLQDPTCPDYEFQRTGKVLVVSQGRSGSTFTSAIIDRHPGVFSTFEPLYSLLQRHPGNLQWHDKPSYPEHLHQLYDNQAIQLIENFLTCSFESLQMDDIANVQLKNLPGSRMLWKCLTDARHQESLQCFLDARRNCLKCPVKQVKVIRFRGQAVGKILARIPDLKVIYLVRDPRGTISSQSTIFWRMDKRKTLNFTRYYCDMFREDLTAVEPLFNVYPDRIKLLRYETLVEDPIQISQELYAFLGLNFTPDVRDFVYSSTHTGNWLSGRYDTFKKDSSAAAYEWRKNIQYEVSQATDEACQDIYDKLGYLPAKTQHELLNLEHKIKKDASFHGKDI